MQIMFPKVFMLNRFFLLLASVLCGVPAYAATTVLTGVNFDVRFDSTLMGSFGMPSLSGNVIFFTPTNFKAESLNGNGIVTASSTVNLQVLPKNGFVIGNFSLVERGDYVLRGAGSYVDVGGQTRAFAISNPFSEVTDPISSLSNFAISNGQQQNWTATSFMSLASLNLGSNQAVNYTIENLLEAYTDSAETGARRAFIEKKFSGFQIAVSPVPEPSSILSLLAGLGFMGFYFHRKRNVQS